MRKRQHQREALVGKAIYQLVADGEVITADIWTEDSILQLMDTQLVRQRDRQLFGLSSLEAATTKKPTSITASSSAKKASKKSKSAASQEKKSKAESSQKKQQSDALPYSTSQDELMGEFNL